MKKLFIILLLISNVCYSQMPTAQQRAAAVALTKSQLGIDSIRDAFLILINSKLDVNGNGNQLTGLTQNQIQNLVGDISAIQNSITTKQPNLISGTNIRTVNGNNLLGSGDINITASTSWGNITGTLSNQLDLQNALNLKSPIANPTFTGTVNGITKTMVGLPNVDNTSDQNKPLSTAETNALATKASIYVGTDAGANDSYVITASPTASSYTVGMVVIFKANTANTTGCTINVSGLGVKNILKRVNTALSTGDILALMYCQLIYDGTAFIIMNPVVN